MTLPILPIEIVNIIIMKIAHSKSYHFADIHRQIRQPVMVQCLNIIRYDTLWLNDTSLSHNPFAFNTDIDYQAIQRLPSLI